MAVARSFPERCAIRSHQHREAGGDDRAGSCEDHPRASSQRLIALSVAELLLRCVASKVREWRRARTAKLCREHDLRHRVLYGRSRGRPHPEPHAHDRGRPVASSSALALLGDAPHVRTSTPRSRLPSTPSSTSTFRGFSNGSKPTESHSPTSSKKSSRCT